MSEIEHAKPETPTPAPVEQPAKKERVKSNLCKVLPTDRIAFDRQVDILRAYAACYEGNGGSPVANETAGATLNPPFSGSTLGVGVPFFTDVALLTRSGTGFVPSPDLLAYNQAVNVSVSEAKRKLRPLFENTWFFRILVPRLQLNPLPLKLCVETLAVEAKADQAHIPRVEPLIKFLELAGIVLISGATVSFVSGAPNAPAVQGATEPQKMESGKGPFDGPDFFTEQEEHHLFLDKEKTKRVTFSCPLFITQAEFKRITNWISATWIVDPPTSENEKREF